MILSILFTSVFPLLKIVPGHIRAEYIFEGFPTAQSVENLPAVQEIQVQSLGQKDPLEKEIVTHSSILAWRIPWIEEPSTLQSMRSQELDTT